MLRSQDFIYLAECKVDEIVKSRMMKMKKQFPYRVFNGWWSMPGGVSVVHEKHVSLVCPQKLSFQAGYDRWGEIYI